MYSSLYLNHSILSNIILPITYLINISLLLLILFRPSSTSFSSLNLDQIIFAVTFLHNPWHAIDVFVRLSECRFKNRRSCLCCTLLMLLYAIIIYTWGVSYSTVLYLIYASNSPPPPKKKRRRTGSCSGRSWNISMPEFELICRAKIYKHQVKNSQWMVVQKNLEKVNTNWRKLPHNIYISSTFSQVTYGTYWQIFTEDGHIQNNC